MGERKEEIWEREKVGGVDLGKREGVRGDLGDRKGEGDLEKKEEGDLREKREKEKI